MKIISVDDLVN